MNITTTDDTVTSPTTSGFEQFLFTHDLLGSRVTTPESNGEFLTRKNLDRLMGNEREVDVATVVAPAGFGKSNWLSHWISCCRHDVCWVSIDNEQNDITRYILYLIAAIKTVDDEFGDELLPMLQRKDLDAAKLDKLFCNQFGKIGGKTLLIIDDFHLVDNQDVHRWMQFLIDNLPPNLQLIISSRKKIPLRFGRFRTHKKLVEIDESHLRFSPQEVANLCQDILKLPVTTDQVVELTAKAEGWIAAIRLWLMSLASVECINQHLAEFSGTHHLIEEYLIEEVLACQNPVTHEFLLQTCMLKSFNGALCDAVRDKSDSLAIIDALMTDNVFVISIDRQHQWFRYHHLFANLLNKFAAHQYSADELSGLQVKAALWHEQQGLIPTAVEYAFESRNNGFICDLIERNILDYMFTGKLSTVLNWLETLEQKQIGRPMISVWHGWILMFTERAEMSQIENQLVKAEAGLDKDPSHFEKYPDILLHVRALRGFISTHQGDLLKGIEQCDAALNEFPDSEPALKGTIAYNIVFSYFTLCDVQKLAPYLPIAIQSSITGGCVYGAVTSTYYKGMAEMLTADFAAAQHTFVSTLRMMSEQGLQDYPFIGYLYLGLSHLNYQWNRLDEAQQHATKAIKLAEQGSESMSILNGYACMIQVHQAKGDCDQALEYIQKAEKIAKTLSVDNRLKEVDAWQALNHAIKGDIGAAKNWSKVSDHLLKDHYNQLYEFEALVLAQILLADKKFDDARIVLNWILQWAQRYQRHLIAAQVKLMLAKTSHYSDDRAAVLPLVLQSMETLEPVSAEIHFVGHREWLSGYLTELRAQNKHAVFCSKLLAAFGQSTKQDTSSKYKELLTKREWDVVYLIKQGLSNNQIATGLSISLGTVKRHVHNLLEKLAVSKRYEIINRLEL